MFPHEMRRLSAGARCALFIVSMVLLVVCVKAKADVNLPAICKDVIAGSATCDESRQRWLIPGPATIVNVVGTGWSAWSAVPDTAQVRVCTADIGNTSTYGSCPPGSVALATKCSVAGANCAVGTGTAALSWTPPTKNTDGSALTNLSGYRIYYGLSPTALNTTIDIQAPASKHTVTDLAVGTWYFSIKTLAGSSESAQSATVSKVIEPDIKVPNAATDLKVASDTTAYDLAKTKNKLSFVAVGSVPAGTTCSKSLAALGVDPAKAVVTMYGVDSAKVTLLAGKARPTVILARCS